MGGSFNNTLSAWAEEHTRAPVAISLDAFAAEDLGGRHDRSGPITSGTTPDRTASAPSPSAPTATRSSPARPATTILLGGTTWPLAPEPTNFPWLAKLDTSSGAVIWSNASGGNINSGEDIWVAVDGSNRVYLAARVDTGGGSWGNEPDAGTASPRAVPCARASTRTATSCGASGTTAPSPSPRRSTRQGASTSSRTPRARSPIGGTTPFNAGGGWDTLSLLFSPTDGSLLSGANITPTFTFPNGGAVDAHGNAFVTGTYWPPGRGPSPSTARRSPRAAAATTIRCSSRRPTDCRTASAALNPGGGNSAQPAAIAADSVAGNVYVAMTVPTTFYLEASARCRRARTSPSSSPDPCDDGAGPAGSSTGTAGNHGDLGPDARLTLRPRRRRSARRVPRACERRVNGAACPVSRGCSYTPNECCFCSPKPYRRGVDHVVVPERRERPGMPGRRRSTPARNAARARRLSCDYCTLQGRLVAQCTAGGWETLDGQIVCLLEGSYRQ